MDGWQDVRENAMNPSVSQLAVNESKRLEKLFKHFQTAVMLNQILSDFISVFELNFLFVNVISLVTTLRFQRVLFWLYQESPRRWNQGPNLMSQTSTGDVWVLPAQRGGANCVNLQLASMPRIPQSQIWLRGRRTGGAGLSAEWKTSSTCSLKLCPEAAAQHAATHVC